MRPTPRPAQPSSSGFCAAWRHTLDAPPAPRLIQTGDGPGFKGLLSCSKGCANRRDRTQ